MHAAANSKYPTHYPFVDTAPLCRLNTSHAAACCRSTQHPQKRGPLRGRFAPTQRSAQFASSRCWHLLLQGHSTAVLRNQMLHSRQAVQCGPRWTKERRRGSHKIKLQNEPQAVFKCTKIVHHPLQPSCDAQDAATCWQVDQMGHTSQHLFRKCLGCAHTPYRVGQ